MYKTCNYTKEEMLRVVAEHASKTLGDDSGVIRAKEKEDGTIEVFFIPHEITPGDDN